jgi:hypothetical protein
MELPLLNDATTGPLTPAIHLSLNLLRAGYTGDIPSPRRVYDLVLRGVLPAERINGRWFYRSAELAGIAATLGLTPPPAIQGPRSRNASGGMQSPARSEAA